MNGKDCMAIECCNTGLEINPMPIQQAAIVSALSLGAIVLGGGFTMCTLISDLCTLSLRFLFIFLYEPARLFEARFP